MAKYTELLADYLENGGSLPAAFSQIEGFDDYFTAYYCDKEIGFETETLFSIKLDLVAKLVMPAYAERIAAKASAFTKMNTPAKVYYETNNNTLTIGQQDSNVKNIPFNAANANPSVINHADESVNENEGSIERTESGQTQDEAIRLYEELNKEVKIILYDLLAEFKHLFMRVY